MVQHKTKSQVGRRNVGSARRAVLAQNYGSFTKNYESRTRKRGRNESAPGWRRNIPLVAEEPENRALRRKLRSPTCAIREGSDRGSGGSPWSMRSGWRKRTPRQSAQIGRAQV